MISEKASNCAIKNIHTYLQGLYGGRGPTLPLFPGNMGTDALELRNAGRAREQERRRSAPRDPAVGHAVEQGRAAEAVLPVDAAVDLASSEEPRDRAVLRQNL